MNRENPTSTFFQKPAEDTAPENTESAKHRMLRSIKRNMHRWHRTIGIVVVIPVIFWTLSGTMHPFIAHWFKPVIAHETVIPEIIPKDQIKLSIQEVLQVNNFSAIRNFRIVKVTGKWYYQVKTEVDELEYFSASDGKQLLTADQLYAEELARYFLSDANLPSGQSKK